MPPAKNLIVLRHRAEFLAVAQHGKKWVTQSFILQFNPSPSPEKTSVIRYGLTASGKIGNAVIRNRARRRMRALAHDILPFHAMRGHDYILIARAATITRDYEDLKKDLLWALKKRGQAVKAAKVVGYFLGGLIRSYRYSFSAIFGRQCRFLPTCSDYALEAIHIHGPVKGSGLAFRRLCRCHPWGGHGFDPVPDAEKIKDRSCKI